MRRLQLPVATHACDSLLFVLSPALLFGVSPRGDVIEQNYFEVLLGLVELQGDVQQHPAAQEVPPANNTKFAF